MEIKSLQETSFDTIFKAFSSAFVDYEIQQNKSQLQLMLKRRGFNPALSFAAFDNEEIVAFTLNGISTFNGIPTAYDTGTGTLKEYRGKGLATKIFEHSLPFLKKKGIKQYLLEVLQHNTQAVSVYRNLEFKTTREFNYFIQKNEAIKKQGKNTGFSCTANPVSINDIDLFSVFWDFYPSWQNSFEAIRRAPEDFIIIRAFNDNKLNGYCVFEPASGDITQIAVEKQDRRKGIGSQLLAESIKFNRADTVKVVNTDISCNSITDFLRANNINVTGKQFEMIKRI